MTIEREMKNEAISTIMTRNVESVSPNQFILDVKHIYEKKKFHHHIPVVENDKLVGMISLIDFIHNIGKAGLDDDAEVYGRLKVKDIMTANPFTSTAEESIEKVARVLAKGEFHAIPIVDAGKLVGIVSTADVISYFIGD